MTNVVGYARVSTRVQNPASQEAALMRAGVGLVFTDSMQRADPSDSSLIAPIDRWVGPSGVSPTVGR